MKIIVDIIDSKIEFEPEDEHLKPAIINRAHTDLGARDPNFLHDRRYKLGIWDGMIDFYDAKNHSFPTGLLEKVMIMLGDMQSQYGFTYSVEDFRPDTFLDVDEMDEEIVLKDEDLGSITLRDYQHDAVKGIIEHMNGIVNLSTNAGKCINKNTRILTAQGYKTLEDIFTEQGISLDGDEEVIPLKYTLINRYGKREQTSHFTKNGIKPTKVITTHRGTTLNTTYNHPLLVDREGTPEWVKAEDLKAGDKLYARAGDNVFGTDKTVRYESEAYRRGALQSATKPLPKYIHQAPRKIQLAFLTGFLNLREGIDLLKTLHTYNERIVIESPCKELLEDLQLVLSNLGILSSLKDTEKSSFTYYGLLDVYEGQEELNIETQTYLQEVISIEEGEEIPTFDVSMPETNSFIGQGIINHNTEVASGIIQQLLPQLERGERIAFFTNNSSIFYQSAKRIGDRLGIKVGLYGGGKKDIQQVTCVMLPTIHAGLTDPEKNVKLTEKERLFKRIAKEVLPQFESGVNQRYLLKLFIDRFEPKTKVDLKFKHELEEVLHRSGSDSEVLMNLTKYAKLYRETIQKKNNKVYKKNKEVVDFLESVSVMICDEAHHTSADTWYYSLRRCINAQYRVALTGSIEESNELLVMRMKSVFGEIVAKVRNKQMIERGFSAKPIIKVFPVTQPKDITGLKEFQEIYRKGIVENEYRNLLMAKLTKTLNTQGKTTLLIVNHTKHGEALVELLEQLEIDHRFIHGQLSTEYREESLQLVRDGKLSVLIATSIVDEGVDISAIDALILCAGGKSLRQTLQRIGRTLRKKKGDNTCQVFDFTDYTHDILLSHSKKRRKIYVEEEFEIVDIQPKAKQG